NGDRVHQLGAAVLQSPRHQLHPGAQRHADRRIDHPLLAAARCVAMNFLPALLPWQWAVLAAVPIGIILLYFLKLRRQSVSVPSTYLWSKTIEDLHVNSLLQRLRRNLLLLL